MLGIDKTTISRFKDASAEFVGRVLHPDERVEFESSENKPYFLAARWAIKEALYKAGNKKIFKETKLTKQDRKYFYPGYEISTTSEGDDYIAIVMKVGK